MVTRGPMKQRCSCRSEIIINWAVASIVWVEMGYQEIFVMTGSASKNTVQGDG